MQYAGCIVQNAEEIIKYTLQCLSLHRVVYAVYTTLWRLCRLIYTHYTHSLYTLHWRLQWRKWQQIEHMYKVSGLPCAHIMHCSLWRQQYTDHTVSFVHSRRHTGLCRPPYMYSVQTVQSEHCAVCAVRCANCSYVNTVQTAHMWTLWTECDAIELADRLLWSQAQSPKSCYECVMMTTLMVMMIGGNECGFGDDFHLYSISLKPWHLI